MDFASHKARPEATNNGHYFADCSCGWSGGVYYGRTRAVEAVKAHREGGAVPPSVKTTFMLGGPIVGQDVRP